VKARWLLALAAPALVHVRASEAQENAASTPYVVQAGDTCVGIATRFYGDKRYVDLIHGANPGMGPAPHNLKAGTRLILPPKPTEPDAGKPDATLTRVRNEVEVTAKEPRPAKGNDPLFRGNRVGTKQSSAADVTFRDETQVKLGENTLVVILGDVEARASRVSGTDMTLVTGELRARLSELAGKRTSEPRVSTDAGVVAMKDGEAHVTIDEKKTTRVAVHRGGSTLTAQNKSVNVNDGYGSKAPKGSAPTPPQLLPPAPEWSAQAPEMVLSAAPIELRFSFAPSKAAGPPPAAWHVQLARDPGFDDLVVDQRVGLPVSNVDARNVAGGSYFARVSAIDGDRFEGKWSTAAHTTVAHIGLTPLPDRRSQLAIDGGSSCTLDGAPASFPLEIDRDRVHKVGCGSQTVDIPMAPLGRARAHAEAVGSGRTGVLHVTIVDEAGQRAGSLRPSIDAPPELLIGPVSESKAKGVYTALYKWRGAPRPTTLRVHANEDVVADTETVDFTREPADTKPAFALELGAGGRAGYQGADAPLALGFDVEARAPIATTHGDVLVGASAGWAKLYEATRGNANAEGSAFSTRAFVGYRFGHAKLRPFVTIGPEVVRQHVEIARVEGRQWLVGGAAGIGLDAFVGPGALFVEARERLVFETSSEDPSLPASSAMGLIGYRLRLP
jgi:hypothetical protein